MSLPSATRSRLAMGGGRTQSSSSVPISGRWQVSFKEASGAAPPSHEHSAPSSRGAGAVEAAEAKLHSCLPSGSTMWLAAFPPQAPSLPSPASPRRTCFSRRKSRHAPSSALNPRSTHHCRHRLPHATRQAPSATRSGSQPPSSQQSMLSAGFRPVLPHRPSSPAEQATWRLFTPQPQLALHALQEPVVQLLTRSARPCGQRAKKLVPVTSTLPFLSVPFHVLASTNRLPRA
mmetsp:Transcript_109688/g.321054  ORF Transcript_109688/g.321054 Transcript_109688/m.321054 type:complete len:232 (-) Transcript_109688:789-1484(-)